MKLLSHAQGETPLLVAGESLFPGTTRRNNAPPSPPGYANGIRRQPCGPSHPKQPSQEPALTVGLPACAC